MNSGTSDFRIFLFFGLLRLNEQYKWNATLFSQFISTLKTFPKFKMEMLSSEYVYIFKNNITVKWMLKIAFCSPVSPDCLSIVAFLAKSRSSFSNESLILSSKFWAVYQPDTSLKPSFTEIEEIATPSIASIMCTIYNKPNK